MTSANTRARTLRILTATLKGGSAKTTTAVLLAIALARKGLRVVLICADTTNRGAARWTQRAVNRSYEIPYVFLEWEPALGQLPRFAKAAEAEHEADVVIVDMGGEKAEFFTHGCLWAGWLISPVSPVDGELDSIGPTYLAAATVSEARAVGLVHSVLLARCPQVGKGMAAKARTELEKDLRDAAGNPDPEIPWSVGAHVFTAEITRGAAYSDFYGHIPDDVGEYAALANEILTLRIEVDL